MEEIGEVKEVAEVKEVVTEVEAKGDAEEESKKVEENVQVETILFIPSCKIALFRLNNLLLKLKSNLLQLLRMMTLPLNS